MQIKISDNIIIKICFTYQSVQLIPHYLLRQYLLILLWLINVFKTLVFDIPVFFHKWSDSFWVSTDMNPCRITGAVNQCFNWTALVRGSEGDWEESGGFCLKVMAALLCCLFTLSLLSVCLRSRERVVSSRLPPTVQTLFFDLIAGNLHANLFHI